MTTRTDTLKVRLEADDDGKVHASLARAATDSEKVSESTGKTSKALGELTEANTKSQQSWTSNSRAVTSFGDLLDDLASGQIGRAKREVAALANETGLLARLFTGGAGAGLMVGGFAALAAVVGVYLKTLYDAQKEQLAFTQALALTGDQSAVTGGQLSSMALDIGKATGEFGDSTKAVLALTQAGHGASPALEGMALMAVHFAQATGDIKAGVDLANAAMGGNARQIDELDRKYNLLTATQADEVQHLFAIGEADKARQIVMREGSQALAKRAQEVQDSTGWMVKAWNSVTAAVSDAWHEMEHAGANDVSSRLKEVNEALAAAQGVHMNASQQFVRNGSQEDIDRLTALQQQLRHQLVQAGFDRTNRAIEDARTAAAKAAQNWANSALAPIDQLQSKLDQAVKAKNDFFAVPHSAEQAERFMRSYNLQIEAAAKAYQSATSPHGSRTSNGNTDRVRALSLDELTAEINAEGRLYDARARANAQVQTFTDNLDQQLAIQQQKYDLEVLGLGMGAKEYQQAQQLLQIRQQEAQALARLNNQYQQQQQQIENSFAGKNDPSDLANKADALAQLQATFDAERAATERYYADDLALAKQHYTALDAARADWRNGLISGMQDWIDQGADVAGQTRDMFTDAFGQMNDALTNFVTTGKLNFGDFAKSVIADLARMELRVIESQILQKLFSLFSGVADNGSASYADYSGGGDVALGTGVVSGGRAGGGPVAGGALYEVAEGGKPEVLSAGGRTYLLMGPDGGYVSPAQRGDTQPAITGQGMQALGGGDSSPQVVVNITNKGQPMQAEQTNARSHGGKVFIDIVVGEVDKRIARGGSTGQAIQQAFGLQRRGVPVGG